MTHAAAHRATVTSVDLAATVPVGQGAKVSICPACGYPTLGPGPCAVCIPLVAAARESRPAMFSSDLGPAA